MHAVARDWRTAPLSPPDAALCQFAEKLTRHQEKMAPSDLDRLREAGFDDRAVHDAVQIVALFNYYTRVADGLGVEAETFIPLWGRNDKPK